MPKPDFQILVPFVKSSEEYDCSYSNPKKPLLLVPTVCKKRGKDIRKFYEDLVNSDECISPWTDSGQNRNTLQSEPLVYGTHKGENSTCSQTKKLGSSFSGNLISTSDAINTNSTTEQYDHHGTKLDTKATSGSLPHVTNYGKTSTCSKTKKLGSSSQEDLVITISNAINTNSSIERRDHYVTKLNAKKTSELLVYSTYKSKSITCSERKEFNSSVVDSLETQGNPSASTTSRTTTSDTNVSSLERGEETEQNTTLTSGSLSYCTNDGKTSTCSNYKSYREPKITNTTSTSAMTNTNPSVSELRHNSTTQQIRAEVPLKNKLDIIGMPSNSKHYICRNTDDVIKKISREYTQNAVLRCAQEGDLPGLKRHLQSSSVNVNCTDSFGWTPLMCASFSGHIDVVKFLLSLDGVNDRYRNRKRQSALGLSIKAGHSHIKELLASYRRDPCVSSSSHKKEETREENHTSTPEFFCDICRMQVKNTTKSAHESSTVHLLNRDPKPLPQSFFLSEQNRGFQMMVKTGWDESKGLGPLGEGRRIPIKTVLKRDRKGLGVKTSDVPRISHFDACDTKAIVHKQSKGIKALNKKKLASIQKREKRKERYLRRCLDF